MQQNFFIIGQPKAGKTTLLKQLVKELRKKLSVGGFVSPEERHHGTRTAFYVTELVAGKTAMLANVNGDGPKVSKYHVDVKSFESVAIPVMENADEYDVVVIDEIGLMELKSKKFSDMLDSLLESDTPVIASLQLDLVEKYGPTGEVIELDEDNREDILQQLLQKTKSLKKKTILSKIIKPIIVKPIKIQTKKKPLKETKPQKKVHGREIKKASEVKEKVKQIEKKHQKEPIKKHGIVDRIKKLFK